VGFNLFANSLIDLY